MLQIEVMANQACTVALQIEKKDPTEANNSLRKSIISNLLHLFEGKRS